MDHTAPLVRHVDDVSEEDWSDPHRRGSTWRTLFSRDVTPTASLTSGVVSVPAGEALAQHRHEAVETYFFIEGSGVLTLGQHEYAVRAGSAVHIPSLTVHGIQNIGSKTLRFFYAFATDSLQDVKYDFVPRRG